MNPVRTSPVPNFASAGFPVVFINASPSGLNIMVGAPFSTRYAPVLSENNFPNFKTSFLIQIL
ncbi:MAG: hypothetical protein M5T52_02770 [Ignavibacteriaceae bacterium]|nr:hypothetical protein [Ignavibacteriaceae bacterium]